jgi:hypothetical protein
MFPFTGNPRNEIPDNIRAHLITISLHGKARRVMIKNKHQAPAWLFPMKEKE